MGIYSLFYIGLYSLKRHCLTGIRIPIINLRRPDDSLRFIIWIPIPIKRCPLSKKRPWSWLAVRCQTLYSDIWALGSPRCAGLIDPRQSAHLSRLQKLNHIIQPQFTPQPAIRDNTLWIKWQGLQLGHKITLIPDLINGNGANWYRDISG